MLVLFFSKMFKKKAVCSLRKAILLTEFHVRSTCYSIDIFIAVIKLATCCLMLILVY